MLLNIVLIPSKPTPKSNFSDGTQCELCVLLPPLSHWEPVPGKSSLYRAEGGGGEWAQEPCAGCPQQRYATEGPGKLHSRGCVGIGERSCGYQASRVSIREKFVLSRNLEYKTRVVAMFLNVVRTPGKPTPKSNLRDGTQCKFCVLLHALSDWGPVPGENSFYRAPRENGHMRRVPGATSSCTPWESHANFQSRDRVAIIEGSCGYWARGVSIRGTFVLSRNIGYKMGGSPCC